MTLTTNVFLTAACCRARPVSPYTPMGRCGYCGERPVVHRYETIQAW